MTRDKLSDLIRAAGLSHISEDLEGLILESIRLVPRESDREQLEMGVSRIGGVPDLPRGVPWPDWNGSPLPFIAQIRLSDLYQVQMVEITEAQSPAYQLPLFELEPQVVTPRQAASIALGVLPEHGILYFFAYDHAEHKRPDWVKERGAWRVMYHGEEEGAGLVRAAAPLSETPETASQKARGVSFWRELTLPPVDAYDVTQMGLSGAEQEEYRCLIHDLEDAHSFPPVGTARLLGHPQQIQNNMQIECHLLSQGRFYEARDGFIGAGMADLQDELDARDWRFLLQVENGWGGCLYYWMPSDAMRHRDFSQAWLVLQYD